MRIMPYFNRQIKQITGHRFKHTYNMELKVWP